jgi:hypothetical protein
VHQQGQGEDAVRGTKVGIATTLRGSLIVERISA